MKLNNFLNRILSTLKIINTYVTIIHNLFYPNPQKNTIDEANEVFLMTIP